MNRRRAVRRVAHRPAAHRPVHRIWLAGSLLVMLGGCDWVDSAGGDSEGEPVLVQFDDPGGGSSLATADEGDTFRVLARLSDPVGDRVWRWEPLDEATPDALAACVAEDTLDESLAADSLAAACTSAGCELVFDEQPPSDAELEAFGQDENTDPAGADATGATPAGGSIVAFDVDVPLLRAPVALRYRLSAVEDEGVVAFDTYDFCLRSINDPPVAVDDRYSVLEGAPLVVEVDGAAPDLLANDRDDLDVANEALRVLTVPARAPSGARRFELAADGGFSYVFSGSDLGEDITDRFEYTVTDGTHESTASVTIRIVARDDAPELVRAIPSLLVTAGIAFEAELDAYFQDPDGATLAFSVVDADTLPAGFTLDESGLLAGTAPVEAVGDYAIEVAVSDGRFVLEEPIGIEVLENLPVRADTVPSQVTGVNRRFRFSTARYFDDPEGETIRYALDVRDPAVDLDIGATTGVITGFVSTPGNYRVSILADDGVNPPTTADFLLEVR